MKTDTLKILMLEDSTADAEMIQRLLKKNNVNCLFNVMMSKAAYELALDEFRPDLILSDNVLLQFTATEALEILQQRGLHIPFILVTETVSEEFAVGIIKAGAADYLLKNRLIRLPAAIEAALKIAQAEKKKLAFEKKLIRSEKRFRGLVENNMSIILLADQNLVATFLSSSATAITGWNNAEFERVDTKEYIHPGDRVMMQGIMDKALANQGKAFPVSLRVRHKNGYYISLEGKINNMMHDPHVGGIITNLTDVTQRVAAEKKIIRVNRLYYFISQINKMIVRTADEATLFAEACRIAVDLGNFKMAWIGIVDEATQQVVPVIYAGDEKEYLTKIKIISVAEIAEGREPASDAIRQGKNIICNDIENDGQMAPWKSAALERGYLSSMSVPIKKFGKVAGVFSFYAGHKNFFDAEEILLLEEATGDVGFALELFDKKVLQTKADVMVAASEQRYHTLTETAPVGIFHTDVDGNTTYVNPCWSQISGLSFKEALGNGWLNAVYKEDKEALIKGWQNATTAREISFSQYRFVHPDGSLVWVIGQAIPERNAQKKIVGYVGTITNVTSLKIAEDIILKEKQLSETIINNLPGIFYLYDTTGKFIRWNRNFEIVTGYSGKEIAIMKPVDFYDEDQKEIITARIKTVFKKKSPGIEVELFTKTSKKIPYYLNSLAINFEGKKCILGMGLDLSERKKAEEEIKKANERYELIGKAASDGLWDWNLEKNQLWSNISHQQLYGLSMADAVPGFEEWKQRIHPEEREQTVKNFEEATASDRSNLIDEYRFYTENKGWVDIYGRTFIERDKAGKAIRLIGSMMDITESKKAAAEITAANKRFEMIAAATNDALFELDILTGRTWHNKAFLNIFNGGNEVKNIIPTKKLWRAKIHPDDKERVINKLEKTYAGHSLTWTDEFRFQKADGSYGTFYDRASITRNEEGTPVRLVGSMIEITELKQAEEKLKEQKAQLQALSDNLPGVTLFQVMLEPDGSMHFTYLSSGVKALAGKDAEEVLNNPSVLYKLIVHEDRTRFIAAQNESLRLMGIFNVELRCRIYTGEMRWLNIISTPTKLDDGRTIWDGFYIDITDRKKAAEAIMLSNERYNLVAKATNDSIWDLNIVTGETTRTGDGFKTLFGYNNRAGINSNTAFHQFVHPEDLSAAKNSMLQVFNNSREFYWEKEYRFLKANGRYAHVYDKGFIIRDKNGKAIRMIGSTQDITRLKENEFHLIKLNNTLQTQAKALADSNAELEQFAYVASHDLQEPLRMVTSFLILLEKKYGNIIDESGKRYIHFAVDGAKRMRQIILDLLELSKVGRKEGEPETINLNIQIQEIIGIFQKDIDDKNAVIEVGELPVIYAYKPSVRQVFQNLIGNAIKYKKNNIAAHIKITAIGVKDYWQFAIADNGVGIEQEYFDRIFIIFQRLHNQNEFSGTGIGLAISKKIIENLDGKIWLTSEFGKGSTFYFTIKK